MTYEASWLDPTDLRWLAFIATQPAACVFHHPFWLDLLASCYGYRPLIATICDSEGNICAGLPLMEVSTFLSARRWVALPFTDHCGPLYTCADDLDALIDSLRQYIQARDVSKIEIRWQLSDHCGIHDGARYVVHTLPLNPDPDVVLKQIHRNHRQNIRTSENREVIVRWGGSIDDMRAFYALQLETRQRHGIPVQPWRYFQLLHKLLVERGMAFILLAYAREPVDRCIAGLICLHWRDDLIAKYAASSTQFLHLRATDLLFWTAIQWGCEHGCTRFDMGRTALDDVGLLEFKRRWGAAATPLCYSVLADHNGSRPSMGRLMPLAQAIIRRSPPWVCRVAGELLYKYAG